MKFSLITKVFAAVLAGAVGTSASQCDDLAKYAQVGTESLIEMYRKDVGLWGDDIDNFNGWWNSANMINIIGLYAAQFPSQKDMLNHDIFENTFFKAQEYAFKNKKDDAALEKLRNTHPTPAVKGGFTRGYFDDDGWWGQAWIQAYDLTGNKEYLKAAELVHDHMASAWSDDKCDGGIFWSDEYKYKNAIANELFLHVSALLANRVDGKRDYYLDWAKKEYEWFSNSGMINANNTINDGLDEKTCNNNGKDVWSYNQGVILSGLVELDKAEHDDKYIELAETIAAGALKQLTKDGILHDTCEPKCWESGDLGQFKGVFTRGLGKLYTVSPKQEYKQMLVENAKSIWNKDRNGKDRFGDVWDGPMTSVTPQTHSSALDTLVSAVQVANCGEDHGLRDTLDRIKQILDHISDNDWFKHKDDGDWHCPPSSHDNNWKHGGIDQWKSWPKFQS